MGKPLVLRASQVPPDCHLLGFQLPSKLLRAECSPKNKYILWLSSHLQLIYLHSWDNAMMYAMYSSHICGEDCQHSWAHY